MNGRSSKSLDLQGLLLRIELLMENSKKEQDRRKNRSTWCLCKKVIPSQFQDPFVQKGFILVVLSIIIAALITPSFMVSRRSYRLGDIADRNIKAKRDILVEDEAATIKKRQEAARQAPAVYDLDENVVVHIHERVQAAFQAMRDSLNYTSRPGIENGLLPDAEPPTFLLDGSSHSLEVTERRKGLLQGRKDFEDLIGFEIPDEIFSSLSHGRFSDELSNRLSQLLKGILDQGIISSKNWLAHTQGHDIIVRKMGTSEEFLMPPPHDFPDLKEARKLIRRQAQEMWGTNGETTSIGFLGSQLLQPNLTFNLAASDQIREKAYAAVKPVYIQVRKNEMLVREGQRIGPEELLKLKGHEQGIAGRHWLLIFVTMFLSSGLCIWVVVHVVKQHIPSYRMDLCDYLFLGILLVILLSMGRATMWIVDLVGDASSHVSGKTMIYAIPLSAGAMMASIFFGVTVSLLFSLLLTLFAGMLFGKDFGLLFYFLIGCYVAAHGVTPCRNRMIPIKAGLFVGCANAVVIVLNAFVHEQINFLGIATNAFFGFSGGIFAGVLVTGFTPLAEMVFGYTTDTKLLELVTMDQPLLQTLMVQAPGTYHHSVIVGNMVEAAAKSIGANALLAKVAAYYHDIGKIKKPLYYIENQVECENRHEKLAPSMSSLILISHVKEGIELARQHHLPKPVIDIICQHHGTSFISFFYKKALEAREREQTRRSAVLPPINIDDYRYPGPKPQTKEAGLVMLADVVEAACRSLGDPTPARIQGMVSRLINNIFSDGQLEDCELTLKDLHSIAKHFNQILATIHHQRIEYPTVSLKDEKGKSDASDPSQRESRPDRDKPGADRTGGRTDLKRLGIH